MTPFKVILGSGQEVDLTATTNTHFTNPVGKQTYAIAVSLAPAATAAYALVTVSDPAGGTGTAATAALDIMVKTTDRPLIIGCAPGQYVNVYPSANGKAFLCELTH